MVHKVQYCSKCDTYFSIGVNTCHCGNKSELYNPPDSIRLYCKVCDALILGHLKSEKIKTCPWCQGKLEVKNASKN